jgi:hypothetical protein
MEGRDLRRLNVRAVRHRNDAHWGHECALFWPDVSGCGLRKGKGGNYRKNNELNELNELRENEFVSVRLSSLFFFSVFDKAKRCMQQAYFHKERRRDGTHGEQDYKL